MFYVARNLGLSFTRSPDAGHGVWNGSWHLVVGTYDGSSVRLYLDGSQVGNGTAHTGPIDYGFPDNDLFIGHYNTCPTEDFHGDVDSPEIYSRALTPSEIRDTYDQLTGRGDGGSPGGTSPGGTSPSQSRRRHVPVAWKHLAVVARLGHEPVGSDRRVGLRPVQRQASPGCPSNCTHRHQPDQVFHGHAAARPALRAELRSRSAAASRSPTGRGARCL